MRRHDSEDDGGAYAVHERTGETTRFARRKGVYELQMEVVPFAEAPSVPSCPNSSGRAPQ